MLLGARQGLPPSNKGARWKAQSRQVRALGEKRWNELLLPWTFMGRIVRSVKGWQAADCAASSSSCQSFAPFLRLP